MITPADKSACEELMRDIEEYDRLVATLRRLDDEYQKIWLEIERIKNKRGGKPPRESQ